MSEPRWYGGKNAKGTTPEAEHGRTILRWIKRKRDAAKVAKWRDEHRDGQDIIGAWPPKPEEKP